jgi:hypothetical protein
LLQELVGKEVEVHSIGGDARYVDRGVLEAFDAGWIRLRKVHEVLYFPVLSYSSAESNLGCADFHMNLLIKNGRVLDPSQNLDEARDVLIENGRIARIEKNISADGVAVLDARGGIVAPGLIDIHVHLRTPGQEYKEDTHTGTAAAAQAASQPYV